MKRDGRQLFQDLLTEWQAVYHGDAPVISRVDLPGPPPERGTTALTTEITKCKNCSLGFYRHHSLPGKGPDNPAVMFIAGAPDGPQDKGGKFFTGPAGQLLKDIIEKGMGLSADQIFVTNLVKCRPPADRDPEVKEIQECFPYLVRQIEALRPKVIICLGRVAACNLLQSMLPLTVLRKKPQQFKGIPVIPTHHPSFLLRTPAAKKETWVDIQQAMSLAGIKKASHRE